MNLEKVQELAASNGIQVSKAVVRDNGNVHVHLPSVENREKLEPLLNDEAFAANKVVTLKSKLPTISILDVRKFNSDEDFVDKIKKQNPKIKQLLDNGSEFSIVYKKEPKNTNDNNRFYTIVARVSDEIRKAIKDNHNKIYIELDAYRVVDRFYIKRCNKCQKFGHYEKDCQNEMCCAYCTHPHSSFQCDEVDEDDSEHYCCNNCEEAGETSMGHSAMWHNCPTYLKLQNKLRKSIPYYNPQKN